MQISNVLVMPFGFAKRVVVFFHDRFPGRRVREDFISNANPPLWAWLRAIFFVSFGMFLNYLGMNSYGQIFITFAFIQLLSLMLVRFFQALAKGMKRKFKIFDNAGGKKTKVTKRNSKSSL